MAESETLDVTLKKPMGIVLEENVSGFGGLRVKEVTDGGSAQVRVGVCLGCRPVGYTSRSSFYR